MFALRLAQGLIGDAREHPRALKLLRRVLRSQPHSAEAWSTAADFHWQRGAHAWATQLYRIASTLQPTHEGAALAYFRAARKVREEERALAYLRARVAGLGKLSRAPWQTLYFGLEELDRTAEGLQELQAALAAYPDDAGLMLFAARQFARDGRLRAAWPLLERARQGTRRSDWLRSAATIHQYAGDLPQALALTREVCALAPLDLGAQREVARLIDAVEGRAAALAHLREARGAVRPSLGAQPAAGGVALRRAARPAGAGRAAPAGHRPGCGLGAARARQRAGAAAPLRRSAAGARAGARCWRPMHRRSTPPAPSSRCCAEIGTRYKRPAATRWRSRWTTTTPCSGCSTAAPRWTSGASSSPSSTRSSSARSRAATACTPSSKWRAAPTSPEELLAILREALAARPDLWHAWVAVGRQLVAMNRLDEALALCDEAVRRFPLLPRVHAERAELMRLRGERAAEQESLREALRLSPGWAQACCRLADSLEAQGDLAGSRAALESAVRHAPGEGYLHGYLADVLWRQDERALSLEHLTRALRLDPGYEWAWGALRDARRGVRRARARARPRPRDHRLARGGHARLARPGGGDRGRDRAHARPGARGAARAPVGARALAPGAGPGGRRPLRRCPGRAVRYRLGRGAAHRAARPARTHRSGTRRREDGALDHYARRS